MTERRDVAYTTSNPSICNEDIWLLSLRSPIICQAESQENTFSLHRLVQFPHPFIQVRTLP